MKFGAAYQEALRKEEYPTQWLESAISYKKLKKCIKRVREELLSLGLDHQTLNALWQHVGTDAYPESGERDAERMMHYQLTTDEKTPFVPKLTIALDPRDGSPMDAWLSPETRSILQKVGTRRERRLSRMPSLDTRNGDHKSSIVTGIDTGLLDTDIASTNLERHSKHTSNLLNTANGESKRPGIVTLDVSNFEENEEFETIEIPLTSDSEFFQILSKELQALERLQDNEKKEISQDIDSLSKDLQVLKSSRSKRSKVELNVWREIFRLYIESEIFLSSHEQDAGARPADKAAQLYHQFIKQLSNVNTNPPKPKSQEAYIALERFLNINTTLIRLLKFQELNRKALSKILKKFDKQTSLHAIGSTTPDSMIKSLTTNPNRPGLSPHDLARSTAFTISQSLLSLIPQLDDYLCPICSFITYKPVRLRCNHVFCIRCMIRLQRDNKDECPMCRQKVVLEATEQNLDLELKKFLKLEFRTEVDEKRKENELQAGKELFGEQYEGTHKCAVM